VQSPVYQPTLLVTSAEQSILTVLSSTESVVTTCHTDFERSAAREDEVISKTKRGFSEKTDMLLMDSKQPAAEPEAVLQCQADSCQAVPSDSELQQQATPTDAAEAGLQDESIPSDTVEAISAEALSVAISVQHKPIHTDGELHNQATPTDAVLQDEAVPVNDEIMVKVEPSNDESRLKAMPSDTASQLKAEPDGTVLQDEVAPIDIRVKHESDDTAVKQSELLSCESIKELDSVKEHDASNGTVLSDTNVPHTGGLNSLMPTDEHNEAGLQEAGTDSTDTDISESETNTGLELAARDRRDMMIDDSTLDSLNDNGSDSPTDCQRPWLTLDSVTDFDAVSITNDSDGLNTRNSQDVADQDSHSASEELAEECSDATDKGYNITLPDVIVTVTHKHTISAATSSSCIYSHKAAIKNSFKKLKQHKTNTHTQQRFVCNYALVVVLRI